MKQWKIIPVRSNCNFYGLTSDFSVDFWPNPHVRSRVPLSLIDWPCGYNLISGLAHNRNLAWWTPLGMGVTWLATTKGWISSKHKFSLSFYAFMGYLTIFSPFNYSHKKFTFNQFCLFYGDMSQCLLYSLWVFRTLDIQQTVWGDHHHRKMLCSSKMISGYL